LSSNNTDLFARTTIEHFIKRYFRNLGSAVAAPAKRLSELDVLPDDER
jgi:hypothetical protein